MKMTVQIFAENYNVDLARPLDIAIPFAFEGEDQVSAFGAPPAARHIYKAGGFIGSVAQGGSCNCETYTFTPHCNGTHTESIGHLTERAVPVHEILKDTLVPATLVTLMPETAAGCEETYNGSLKPEDLVITKASLVAIPLNREIRALVVRTLPNDDSKLTKHYGGEGAMPPYFTREATEYIATSKIRHLLVDMPSIDRMDDGGALANHRIFWGLSRDEKDSVSSPRTVTELIYAPDSIEDGLYLLNIQIAPFMTDAAPSRPVLFEVEKV